MKHNSVTNFRQKIIYGSKVEKWTLRFINTLLLIMIVVTTICYLVILSGDMKSNNPNKASSLLNRIINTGFMIVMLNELPTVFRMIRATYCYCFPPSNTDFRLTCQWVYKRFLWINYKSSSLIRSPITLTILACGHIISTVCTTVLCYISFKYEDSTQYPDYLILVSLAISGSSFMYITIFLLNAFKSQPKHQPTEFPSDILSPSF